MLSPAERLLSARLAVSSGGFTLEAAEQVAAADAGDHQSLIEQNLVQRTGGRYRMLETIWDSLPGGSRNWQRPDRSAAAT